MLPYISVLSACLLLLFSLINATEITPATDSDLHMFLSKMKSEITTGTIHLKKTHYSNKKRVIFVAGLEGSGHHGLKAMFDVCMKDKTCFPDIKATESMMYYDKYTKGLFSAFVVDRSVEYLTAIYESWKKFASEAADGP